MPRVLVIATSRKTRGGITSVVKAHEVGKQWRRFHCRWLQTHRDGLIWIKVAYMVRALVSGYIYMFFYDVVHIHFSNENSLRRKLLFAKMAKSMRKSILIHFHGYAVDTTFGGQYKDMYYDLFLMSDRIVVLSNWWRDEILKMYPNLKDKIVVLYNPCEKVVIIPFVQPRKMILYAGTLNIRKGYADLIKAFALIASKYRDWTLSLAGNGEIEKARKLVRLLGLEGRVEFLGWVSGEDKARVFQSASIFCLPSYAEGFPMAVLDAWTYGLPVITTPVGGIPDIAKDGDNMLIFTPGDVDALAAKLELLISDASLRAKISEASKELATTTFNIDRINSQLGEIYNSLLSSSVS